MDEWMTQARDALAEVSGIPAPELELTDENVDTLLDLAGLAAHKSGARTNAPLLCYLLGKAERGADLNALATAIRELS
jgi:hypothetical protein